MDLTLSHIKSSLYPRPSLPPAKQTSDSLFVHFTSSVPVGGLRFQWSITEVDQVSAGLWVTGPPQRVHPHPQTDLEAVVSVGALGAVTGEVTGLVGLDGAVGPVVPVGGQRMLLLRLHVIKT